jgi:four helix bundle protein
VRGAECGVPNAAWILRARFNMGWKRFTDIEAWQLSMELHKEVVAVLARRPASHDRDFCTEVRSALASAPRNIAEGFGRYGHKEFANFVSIARASLLETQTNLHLALDREFLSAEEFERLWRLSEQTLAATTGLLKYLRSSSRVP